MLRALQICPFCNFGHKICSSGNTGRNGWIVAAAACLLGSSDRLASVQDLPESGTRPTPNLVLGTRSRRGREAASVRDPLSPRPDSHECAVSGWRVRWVLFLRDGFPAGLSLLRCLSVNLAVLEERKLRCKTSTAGPSRGLGSFLDDPEPDG